ncbi:Uncharacterized protein Fot_10797 [Forsythia ovata]|uniref:Uncharacterized protein n=1 Tax=Forsythia ovata TaxID=205694 RepID=A0ABD1WHV0_9LAMI
MVHLYLIEGRAEDDIDWASIVDQYHFYSITHYLDLDYNGVTIKIEWPISHTFSKKCIMHLIEIFSEHGQRVAIVIFRHLDKIRHPLSMKNFCGALIHYWDEDAEYLAVQLIFVEKEVDDAIALKSSTTVTNQVEASLEDGATNRLSTPKD